MTYVTLKDSEPGDALSVASPSPGNETREVLAPDRNPILVAVDFSADSTAALGWAVDQADILGAPVHIVHVVHDPAEAPGKYRPNKDDPLRPMADAARDMMTDFIGQMRHDRPQSLSLEDAKTTILTGLPAPAILHMAKRLTARLVVVGTRGRKGFRRLFLGSIAGNVVQNSSVPVTVVKPETP